MPGRSDIELEDVVPLGDDVVPLFWLYETGASEFVETVESNAAVENVIALDETTNRTLYALQWDATRDTFLGSVTEFGGFLLSATGSGQTWMLRFRFPDHDALSAFSDRCSEMGVDLDVTALYNRTRPSAGRWYGLTETQYETLLLARERGYYDIPRRVSTQALADELGVSDQAVTERLRRAIRTLTDNALRPDTAGDGSAE
ncbi:hypothetical protein MBEHAL_1378 [Halarchaeum acidiphilum MH1-52-1]|uniref:Bacterio-opsin activator domain-containing protein n=1 Tax=Halarchaeum acidiphilum MH1-52-1 TaxID=1261545 RepID=U3ACW8_9EURY|nr:hypothetical protein MBEHAL_1378 [Halarchaeum acidiphilum MH1-52-1]